MSPEEFTEQVNYMRQFMSLIIKIGMMQMPGAGNSDELVSKLYSSFFPMRNDAWQ